MAVTYRARDTILNSVVALKVIDQTIAANPVARRRFLREARAAAQLHHPNVARVSHYGEQDGECFYVMDLVAGETLEAHVRREGPMPLALALEVVEQATRALAAAEALGIVHRDIKPSNLMTETDASGATFVKVIDYGVAKVATAVTEVGADQTQAGFIGTPAFASPEQFLAESQRTIDTRSDIYSLGATLWYLLTGRTPFVGRTMDELRTRQGDLPLEQLRRLDVPAPVLTMLKSMLAVDPADRPQSARELLAAVHLCYRRFEPIARRRRKRLVLGAALAAALLTATLLGLWLYQQRHSSSQIEKAIAVMPFENLSVTPEDQFLTVGLQDEILTKLASVEDLKVIARSSTESYRDKPTKLSTIGRQLGVGKVLEGSVLRVADQIRVNVKLIDTRTNTHLWASTYDRTLDDILAVETDIANSVVQRLGSKLVQKISTSQPTKNTAAYEAYLRGRGLEHGKANNSSRQQAAAAYAEAVQLDPNFALAWARLALARSYLYPNGIDPNANSATTVKEAADRAMELQPDLGEAWLAVGQYRNVVLHDRVKAMEAYHQAEKYLPNSSLVNEYMCTAEVRLGHWREAVAHYQKAVELDPQNVRLLVKIAPFVYEPLNRHAEAIAALDRALQISPNDDEAIAKKSEVLENEGRLDESGKLLAQIPQDSPNIFVINCRVWHAMYKREFDEAIAWSERAISPSKPGEPLGVLNLGALVRMGYFQEWAGRPEEARVSFQRVIHEISPSPGAAISSPRETRSILALAYAGLGDKQNALEQARQGVADFADDAILKPRAEKYLAEVQARCGELDQAIDTIRHLMEVPNGLEPMNATLFPFWDPLRNNPRFEELLKHPPPVRY